MDGDLGKVAACNRRCDDHGRMKMARQIWDDHDKADMRRRACSPATAVHEWWLGKVDLGVQVLLFIFCIMTFYFFFTDIALYVLDLLLPLPLNVNRFFSLVLMSWLIISDILLSLFIPKERFLSHRTQFLFKEPPLLPRCRAGYMGPGSRMVHLTRDLCVLGSYKI